MLQVTDALRSSFNGLNKYERALYVAGYVDAGRGVLCGLGSLYMDMRPAVKG
jgi:hypothetical protein